MKYMVDTCIINRLVDGLLSTSDLPSEGEYMATHVQMDELKRTSDLSRRVSLLQKFTTLVDDMVPTASTVLGVSKVGQCKLSDGNLCETLRAELDKRNKGKKNNIQDALIAEVAIQRGWTLLTTDNDLAKVALKNGCRVQDPLARSL